MNRRKLWIAIKEYRPNLKEEIIPLLMIGIILLMAFFGTRNILMGKYFSGAFQLGTVVFNLFNLLRMLNQALPKCPGCGVHSRTHRWTIDGKLCKVCSELEKTLEETGVPDYASFRLLPATYEGRPASVSLQQTWNGVSAKEETLDFKPHTAFLLLAEQDSESKKLSIRALKRMEPNNLNAMVDNLNPKELQKWLSVFEGEDMSGMGRKMNICEGCGEIIISKKTEEKTRCSKCLSEFARLLGV